MQHNSCANGLRYVAEGRLTVEVLDAMAIGASLVRGRYWDADAVMFLLGLSNILEGHVHMIMSLAPQAGLLLPDERIKSINKALMADAIGTTVGVVFGSSTVTSYLESASGIAAGGRSGLTALTAAAGFMFALFFAPLFLAIPGVATYSMYSMA